MVAIALHHEYCCIIKDPVKGTEQGGVFAKELSPFIRTFITGEDYDVWSFFVVPAVDHIKEHSGALFIKDTPTDLIYDQTGKLNQAVDGRTFTTIFA